MWSEDRVNIIWKIVKTADDWAPTQSCWFIICMFTRPQVIQMDIIPEKHWLKGSTQVSGSVTATTHHEWNFLSKTEFVLYITGDTFPSLSESSFITNTGCQGPTLNLFLGVVCYIFQNPQVQPGSEESQEITLDRLGKGSGKRVGNLVLKNVQDLEVKEEKARYSRWGREWDRVDGKYC